MMTLKVRLLLGFSTGHIPILNVQQTEVWTFSGDKEKLHNQTTSFSFKWKHVPTYGIKYI